MILHLGFTDRLGKETGESACGHKAVSFADDIEQVSCKDCRFIYQGLVKPDLIRPADLIDDILSDIVKCRKLLVASKALLADEMDHIEWKIATLNPDNDPVGYADVTLNMNKLKAFIDAVKELG